MTTIRNRISRPYLAIIVLIPITILLLFNLIVSIYTSRQATQDLQAAVAEIAETLKRQNFQNSRFPENLQDAESTTNESNMQGAVSLITLINQQKHSSSAELVVFNRSGELAKMFNTDSFVTDELAALIYDETEKLDYNEIGSLKYASDTYYVVEVEYESLTMTDKVVYISKGLVIDEFVSTVNIVLIIVSVIITLIALFVSSRVTNAIAKPIEHLTSLVENMRTDEIIAIDDRSDSLELQKLTKEINELNRRIYQYNESQKSFLHNASHELRTPLMSIQGYADGIEMGIFEDAKGTAHLISDQSKRLTKLVDSLLSLARVENFSENNKLEMLDIGDCLLELIEGYRGYALSHDIEIKTQIAQNICANASNELICSSVGNVLSNAIRYASACVKISLAVVDSHAVIMVRDDGAGIAQLETIFDRFSKGEDGNFGLGLSIAKTSAEMMGGELIAYNDGGAVFELKLPL